MNMACGVMVAAVPNALVALAVAKVKSSDHGEVICIVVTCTDFDHYRNLPEAVSYNGIRCGKTGWNSDKNYACYQSNATIVDAVQ